MHRCRPKIWQIRIFFLKKVFLLLVFLKLTLVSLKRMGHYDKWFHYFILPTFAIKYNLTPIKTLFCIILISHCSRRYDKDVDDDLCYMRSYSLMAIKLMRSIVILLGSRKNYTWLKGHWKVTHGWSKMYMSTFYVL